MQPPPAPPPPTSPPAPRHCTQQARATVATVVTTTPALTPATAAAAAGGPLSEVDSFPLAIPLALEAVEVAMPAFVGEEPPPLQVSAELRTAWADALTSLEARQQERKQKQEW